MKFPADVGVGMPTVLVEFGRFLGNHWVMLYSMPSLFIHPERRICLGTCAVQVSSK